MTGQSGFQVGVLGAVRRSQSQRSLAQALRRLSKHDFLRAQRSTTSRAWDLLPLFSAQCSATGSQPALDIQCDPQAQACIASNQLDGCQWVATTLDKVAEIGYRWQSGLWGESYAVQLTNAML
jgi:hypothetical protein